MAPRHLPPRLPFKPLLALKVLTVRAAAMPAGMGHEAGFVAARAHGPHARCHGRAAQLQGSQGLALNGMPINGQSRLNPGDTLTLGSITYGIDFEEVIEQALGASASSGVSVPRLGEYFIRRGILSREQVLAVAERQSRLQRDGSRLQFGQVAYEMGVITRSQLDMALADQRSDFNDRFY